LDEEMSLARLRARLPLIAFLLLAAVCLALLGFACACLSDHPIKAFDRSVAALSATPAVLEVWSPILALLAGGAVVLFSLRPALARSPSLLQRFLFSARVRG
jgi:hypothetical protein